MPQGSSVLAPLCKLQGRDTSTTGERFLFTPAVELRICDGRRREARQPDSTDDSGRLCGLARREQGGFLGHAVETEQRDGAAGSLVNGRRTARLISDVDLCWDPPHCKRESIRQGQRSRAAKSASWWRPERSPTNQRIRQNQHTVCMPTSPPANDTDQQDTPTCIKQTTSRSSPFKIRSSTMRAASSFFPCKWCPQFHEGQGFARQG